MEEFRWIISITEGKGWKAFIMKMAIAETVYSTWLYRNSICFGKIMDNTSIDRKIIDSIVYNGWQNTKLRAHIANMMM